MKNGTDLFAGEKRFARRLYVFALRQRAHRMCVSGVKLSESRMVCRGRKRIQTPPAPAAEEVY